MDYWATLTTEISTDPAAMGYAGQNWVRVGILGNTPANLLSPPRSGTGWTKTVPVSVADVLAWAATPDTTVTPNAPSPISLITAGANNESDPVQGECQAALVLVQGWSLGTLDESKASITGLIAALQAAGKFNANQEATLLALGVVPCSRFETVFGPGIVVPGEDCKRVMGA